MRFASTYDHKSHIYCTITLKLFKFISHSVQSKPGYTKLDHFRVWFYCLQIVYPILKCPKIEQDKIPSNFDNVRCENNRNLKNERFL